LPTRLMEILAAHVPEDASEAASLETMKRFATTLEQPLSRHQADAHFTASALVIDEQLGRVALVHHAKLRRWLQPGGHAESEDNGLIHLTALREAREETGCTVSLHPGAPSPLDVDVHLIPAHGGEQAHHHLDIRFLVVAQDPEALTFNDNESLAARWFTFAEALSLADEAPLQRLIRKGQRTRANPATTR
jgi:8-oxo-dGTP pyrophosphatase MutT (NUDIX family)